MGEAESFDREPLVDGRATAADDGDAAARTVGADPADSGPAELGVESGDGEHATQAGDAVIIPRTEATSGRPPDPAAATVDGRRDAGMPAVPGGAPSETVLLRI